VRFKNQRCEKGSFPKFSSTVRSIYVNKEAIPIVGEAKTGWIAKRPKEIKVNSKPISSKTGTAIR